MGYETLVAKSNININELKGFPLLEAEDLCLTFGERPVLDRVSLHVRAKEIVTIVGVNGSGKSSLLKCLLGLVVPDRGRITKRDGLTIGYTPQSLVRDQTLPLTVRRFISLGAPLKDGQAEVLLEEVGARHVIDSSLANISGGEMNRVLLARALAREPDLLVLDEPMSGVDVAGQAELYGLIAAIRDRRGCGVLMVSHDLHVVMAQTDVVLCLNHHICCSGHPHAVVRHPEFVSLFGERAAQSLALYEHHHDHHHDAHGDVQPLEAGEGNYDHDHDPRKDRGCC